MAVKDCGDGSLARMTERSVCARLAAPSVIMTTERPSISNAQVEVAHPLQQHRSSKVAKGDSRKVRNSMSQIGSTFCR